MLKNFIQNPVYTTENGAAYCADSLEMLKQMDDFSINLVLTSPPFALQRQKEYGNKDEYEYIDWLAEFAALVHRKLRDDGSFVLDLGGAYRKGVPARSLYNFRVLLKFCDDIGFHLAEDFYWFNPSKLPSPIEWVNKRKIRAKAFSRLADVRVIFGGDETVNYFRRLPLKPTGKEIVFPDRFSYAAIRASSYLQKTKEERQALANRFFLDSYTFDQSACSSPKLLFWIGDQEKAALAATSFYEFLEKEIERRRFTLSDGGSVLKWSYLFDQSLHKEVIGLIRGPGALSVVALSKPEKFCRIHCGQGLFYHIALTSLEEIYPFVEAKDQTLTYDGFSVEELRALASCLNGKGITRMVPIGQALDFSPLWDGQDLFVELTQKIGVYG